MGGIYMFLRDAVYVVYRFSIDKRQQRGIVRTTVVTRESWRQHNFNGLDHWQQMYLQEL